VLELPRKSKVGWSWRPGIDRYIAVRCQVNMIKTSRQTNRYDYKTQSYVPTTVYDKNYNIKAPEENSPVEKFDLNGKSIWLVKRETI
jgi:hypothetical protein